MTEPLMHASATDIRVEVDDQAPPAAPRWVKLLGIGGVVLVLVFAGLHLTGHVPMHGMP